MRLGESILKCFECGHKSTAEEVEIVERDGKRFWVCPNCDKENPLVDKVRPKFWMVVGSLNQICEPES